MRGLLAFSVAIAAVNASVHPAKARQRDWDISTSLSMRYFADVTVDDTAMTDRRVRPVLPSPNGEAFVVLTRRGALDRDETIYELRLFSVAEVVRAVTGRGSVPPRPRQTLSLRSPNNAPAISHPRWVDGGRAILFAGAVQDRVDSRRQLFRWDVSSGDLTALGQPSAYSDGPTVLDSRGNQALISNAVPDASLAPRDGYPATTGDWSYFASFGGARTAPVRRFLSCASNGSETEVQMPDYVSFWNHGRLSPSGRQAVMAFQTVQTSASGRGTGAPPPLRLALVDCSTGAVRPLLNQSLGWVGYRERDAARAFNVLWSRDETSVIISNVLVAGIGQANDAASTGHLVDVDLRNGAIELITPARREGSRIVSLDECGDPIGLCVSWADSAGGRSRSAYADSPRGWIAAGDREAESMADITLPTAETVDGPPSDHNFGPPEATRIGRLNLTLFEGPGEPQRLVASLGRTSRDLFEPDPALADVRILPSQVVEWTDPDGRRVRGLLVLPRSRSPGPPPLVVQIGRWIPHVFRPDGPYASGFATQLLAASGMAVLTINDVTHERPELVANFSVPNGHGAEGPTVTQTVTAAVESLSRRGLIDPDRVGILGYSRTGYQAYYVATHPGNLRIRVALAADSFTGGYFQYVYQAAQALESVRREYEYVNGPGTFWANPDTWLRESPEFNIHRMQGAFLYWNTRNGFGQAADLASLTGTFRLNRRPIEVLNFPLGSHPIVRPRERQASLDATNDWMSFWLLGREDPDPGKAAQYSRWRQMRDDLQSQLAWEAAGNPVGSVPQPPSGGNDGGGGTSRH